MAKARAAMGDWFGILPRADCDVEATTNGGYKQMLARIQRNNDAVAGGAAGEFGRHVAVRELQAEVPLDYLFNFSRKRIAKAVDLGVDAARAWCAQNRAREPNAPARQ